MNSERYLVANKFLGKAKSEEIKREGKEGNGDKNEGNEGIEEKEKEIVEKEEKGEIDEKYELVIQILEKAHKSGFTDESSISSLFPVDWLKAGIFNLSFSKGITISLSRFISFLSLTQKIRNSQTQ